MVTEAADARLRLAGERRVGGIDVIEHVNRLSRAADFFQPPQKRFGFRRGHRFVPARGAVISLVERFDQKPANGIAHIVEHREPAVDDDLLVRKPFLQRADDPGHRGPEGGLAPRAALGESVDGIDGIEKKAVIARAIGGVGEDSFFHSGLVTSTRSLCHTGFFPRSGTPPARACAARANFPSLAHADVSQDALAGPVRRAGIDVGLGRDDGKLMARQSSAGTPGA